MADVPRRLRRFYRGEKPTEQEMKEKSTELAIKEVDKFRQANERYPARQELDLISDNVFEQLKREIDSGEDTEGKKSGDPDKSGDTNKAVQSGGGKNFLEQRREKRAAQGTEKSGKGKKKSEEDLEEMRDFEGDGGAESGELSPEELLEEPRGTAADEDSVNVQKLAELDELSNLEKDLSDDDSDLVEKEVDSDLNICPHCNSRADDLFYCPNCGEAFCDHCAKAVEVQAEAVKYTCPKCGKDFKKTKNKR